jgi:hypothetical protein
MVIPVDLGSGDQRKVRAYNGEEVVGWRNVFKENNAKFALPYNKLPIKINQTYLLTYLLTYYMEQSPSWEANRFLASQEIPRILWNQNVH